jgi:hypothetical protein
MNFAQNPMVEDSARRFGASVVIGVKYSFGFERPPADLSKRAIAIFSDRLCVDLSPGVDANMVLLKHLRYLAQKKGLFILIYSNSINIMYNVKLYKYIIENQRCKKLNIAIKKCILL